MSSRISHARVTVFALAGALAGVVPLPVVPRRIMRAIRGAMAHDVCGAHGLALTPEAREAFAEPYAGGQPMPFTKDALAWIAGRALARFSPYGRAIAPVTVALETAAFGRLLDRYLDRYRATGPNGRVVRIEGDEAATIRRVLDRAAQRAIRPGLAGTDAMASEAPEDHRDSMQRAVDAALIGAARLPEWIARRLDAALDEVMATSRPGEAA